MGKQNVVYICNGILFSLEKEGMPTRAMVWMDLEDIITLSEMSQSQKDKYGLIPLIRGTWGRQSHRDRSRLVAARG